MNVRSKKVLHVAPTPFFADRGCHIRIRGIVSGLADRGFKSLVCTYPIGRDVDSIETVRCLPIPGYTKTSAGPSGYKYLADIFLLGTVANTLRRYQPDILHCHLHEGVLIGWLAKRAVFRSACPVIFDMQGSLTGELSAHGFFKSRPYLHRFFRWLERKIIAMADIVICSSEASAKLLVDDFGVDRSVIFVARDGADVSFQHNSPVDIPAANAGISTVIYSGGLAKSKGLGALQDVLHEARQRALPVRFLIVGYPTDRLEEFVAEQDLTSNCILTGQIPFDELSGYLSCAAVALEPKPGGSGEASGKLVNYMAAGLPVVCFDTLNNRDMLGDNGFFASDGDIGAFVDRLEEVINNPGDAERAGNAGKERVRKLFSWSAAAEQVIAAYARVGCEEVTHSDESRHEEGI